jgi:2-polyprenyl-3-methyl-5-hydroxy-6-metoxy-1,4-benzoquinol methylase
MAGTINPGYIQSTPPAQRQLAPKIESEDHMPNASTRLTSLLDELRTMSVDEVDDTGSRHHLYGAADTHALGHIRDDRGRLELFLSAVLAQTGNDILELGANPYILTYALARSGYNMFTSGAPTNGERRSLSGHVQFARQDEAAVSIPLSRFNVESDQFPYEAESFDVVICGELIEHLIIGPHNLLFECNRVLRSGGLLLLSTPNAVSFSQIESLVRGRNIHWPFSSQGVYGRHNRLYTFTEITELLTGNGFDIVDTRGITRPMRREWFSENSWGAAKWGFVRAIQHLVNSQPRRLKRISEGMFMVGRKSSGPHLFQPPWLYGDSDTVPMTASAADT